MNLIELHHAIKSVMDVEDVYAGLDVAVQLPSGEFVSLESIFELQEVDGRKVFVLKSVQSAYSLWLRIEDIRLERGWSGVAMAEHIGLPRNTIGRLKTSTNKPSVVTVHTIADALDIPRREAEELAGLRLPAPVRSMSTEEAIMADPTFTKLQRELLLEQHRIFTQSNQVGLHQEGGRNWLPRTSL